MGVTAAAGSASGAGVQLCPSAPDGEAASFGTASATSSLVAGPPFDVASLPGSSCQQHVKESSRLSGRHRRSSSSGTTHASTIRPGVRSSSPFR